MQIKQGKTTEYQAEWLFSEIFFLFSKYKKLCISMHIKTRKIIKIPRPMRFDLRKMCRMCNM